MEDGRGTRRTESSETEEEDGVDHETEIEYDELLEAELPENMFFTQDEAEEAERAYVAADQTFQEARDQFKRVKTGRNSTDAGRNRGSNGRYKQREGQSKSSVKVRPLAPAQSKVHAIFRGPSAADFGFGAHKG